MNNCTNLRFCAGIALFAQLAPAAYADGPLLVDPNTRTGCHFSKEPIPVYYDLGIVWDYSTPTPQEVVFDNAAGAPMVRKGYGDWSSVPTAAVGAFVAGDFSQKGLPDIDATAFQGVATHEFGHSLGLAHSQVNGAAVTYGEAAGPASCTALPYALGPTRADVETMYPYINPTPHTGTGAARGLRRG